MRPSSVAAKELLREYTRSEAVIFHRTREAHGGLSNMAPGFPLVIEGVRIRTTEALYQACRFPHLPDVQATILEQRSPMVAKMKSKPYRNLTRGDWDAVRHRVMRWCLRVKLAQHYEGFGRLLLSTGDFPIVELSRKDDFWGAKIVDDAAGSLVGQNILGRLLMELREALKTDSDGSLRVVYPPPISDFYLLGRPIGTVTSEVGSHEDQRRLL